MNNLNIISPEKTLFPETNQAFKTFCKNLAVNLENKSNGQIRRKPEWLGAVIASSLPNKESGFNINTLKDIFSKQESMPFSKAIGELESLQLSLESDLCEIGNEFLANYSNQAWIGFDADTNDYDAIRRIYKHNERQVPTCDCEDFDECHSCRIEIYSTACELDAISHAILNLIDVKEPTMAELIGIENQRPKAKYLVIFMDTKKGIESIESLHVRIDSNEPNINAKIAAKLSFHVQKQGKTMDSITVIKQELAESLVVL
ncbi:hypothetical protein LMH73_014735 [Vibrio splendidus]|nr:hypothetical protein [Vibrio splendidus]MCC4882930.1 hypothetical protein [Vibrio splendidus]